MVQNQVVLEKLETRCEQHRQRGKELRGKSPRKSAQHLLKAASLANRIADLEEDDRLSFQRRELADNLERAAREQMAGEDGDVETVGVGPDNSDGETTATTAPIEEESDPGHNKSSSSDEWEYFEDPPSNDFTDIGGLSELIEKLRQEVIIPFEYPELADRIGANINNGILMEGKPGVGKTHVARCLAGELGYRFAEVDDTMLGSQYVNEGGENIANLFDEAKAVAPCVLFLDELDSLAGKRDGGARKTNSERGMVTKLLRCMEAIQNSEILVIGATNLVEDVDGAIRRSGRFDATYTVRPPNTDARREIFDVHLANVKTVDGEVDKAQLAELTDGFSGADIEAVVERATRVALRDAVVDDVSLSVTQSHLEAAIKETTPSVEAWDSENSLAE